MNIKAGMTSLFAGLFLLGLSVSSAQAIPLTMSFNIADFTDPAVNGTIKFDSSDPFAIDTLTFVDLTVGLDTYGIDDVTYDATTISGSGFSLTLPDVFTRTGTEQTSTFSVTRAVPEPTTLSLLGLGLALLGSISRKKS